jgi:RecB family exonuclease
MRATAGFWTASARVDAFSTAMRLLDMHEALSLAGWDVQPCAPRLAELSRVVGADDASLGARLKAVAAALTNYGRELESVDLLVPAHTLPLRVRQVLEVLQARGVEVRHRPLEPANAPADSDLMKLSGRDARPDGDGTVQLVRPYGWLTAADAVAAALAATPETPTLILGADRVLDASLRRYGLPTTGAPGAAHDNAVLQVLPLLVAVGASPVDPQRAAERLTLPASPIPQPVARKLVRALQHEPAVDGDTWRATLDEALEDLAFDRRDAARACVQEAFAPLTRLYEPWPVDALLRRADGVRSWLHGREQHEADPLLEACFGAALAQVNAFTSLVEAVELPALTPALVRRLFEHATAAAPSVAPHRCQAGFVSVGDPGSIAGPIARIVWWNFTRDSVSPPHELPLTKAERSALAAVGAELPTTGQRAEWAAETWTRPFLQAARTLWLVCPQHAENGDDAEPHPAWDEVLARLASPRLASVLTHRAPSLKTPVKRTPRDRLPLPQPQSTWDAGRAIPARDVESPSSLEDFLGCELKWVLRYAGNLRFGQTAALDTGPQLLGTLTHELIARVLRKMPLAPAEAEKLALTLFDTEGPRLATALFLPGAEAERADARSSTAAAARWLARFLADGWTVEHVEDTLSGTAFGGPFAGKVDCVVSRGKTKAVIDLKQGSGAYYRDSLAKGTSVQLAAYAELLRQAGAHDVAVGYFILRTQQMFSGDERLAKPPLAVEHDVAATWKASPFKVMKPAHRAGLSRWRRGAAHRLWARSRV